MANPELTPPPYPPPLPMEMPEHTSSSSSSTSTENTKSERPNVKNEPSLKKRLSKKYNHMIEQTPEIVAYFQKHFKSLSKSIKNGYQKVKSKLPASQNISSNIGHIVHDQSGDLPAKFKGFIKEETPLYTAFISIGSLAVVFALLIAFFVSPATWIIIFLAGLLQIATGIGLKSRAN